MPSTNRCVFGCDTTGVTIHNFPQPAKFPERFKIWVKIAGKSLHGLSDKEIYNRKKVCNIHFKESDHNRNNRLSSVAVPSLYLACVYCPLHIFPNPMKDPERFTTWVLSIGGDIVGLANEFIYKYRRVCHAHFEDKFYCRNDRISNIAVPTLNLTACSTIASKIKLATMDGGDSKLEWTWNGPYPGPYKKQNDYVLAEKYRYLFETSFYVLLYY